MQRSGGSRSTSPTGGQGSLVSPAGNVRNKPQGRGGRSSASSPLSPDRLSQQQQQHSAMCPCCSCWTCLPLHQRSSSTSPVASPPPVLGPSGGVAHLAVRSKTKQNTKKQQQPAIKTKRRRTARPCPPVKMMIKWRDLIWVWTSCSLASSL